MQYSERDARLDDGAGPRSIWAMANKLAEAQVALDEAAERGELKEGTYMDISKKFKECVEERNKDIKRAKFDMFVTMTHSAPNLVGSPVGGVWPLGQKVIEAVTKSARINKVPPSWWVHAMSAYYNAIFEDSKSSVPAGARMEAFVDLAEHLNCTEDKVLYNVLTERNACFLCKFAYDVEGKDLYLFAEAVIMRAPYLIRNVKACDAHGKTGFTQLKHLARTEACKCAWGDYEFVNTVGPRFPRRSKRTRTDADNEDEKDAQAHAELCCASECA